MSELESDSRISVTRPDLKRKERQTTSLCAMVYSRFSVQDLVRKADILALIGFDERLGFWRKPEFILAQAAFSRSNPTSLTDALRSLRFSAMMSV